MIRKTLLGLALAGASTGAFAGECETNFSKSGSVFSGTDFSSRVTVADLSLADAMGQMRGIMIAEKMDVITEDLEGGTLLVEQRATGTTRAIPTLINVSASGTAAVVAMTVKTEKGQIAKQDAIRPYMCDLLGRVKGGDAGRTAGAAGAGAQNAADTTVKDVFIFSREIAREAKANAVAVNARHKGRSYALSGRVDYIQEDGEEYNVSFDIPEQSELQLRLPNDEPRVGVACLFKPNQLANVLTFRKGEKAQFTGSFLRYDDFKRMVWLENCRQTR
ncbi:hypothetical protein [Arenimonas sp. MALMAid1274]|uniref:hypothetical protein n=1 Tax=Arenimonas sp. MALMAid1274 TaxID=3411630 RepID=UPI003BA0EB90